MKINRYINMLISDDDQPVAILSDCGATVTITNGFVNFTKVLTTFGQTLPIVCEKGYKHSGGSTIRCEADGEWKTTASCEIIGQNSDMCFCL